MSVYKSLLNYTQNKGSLADIGFSSNNPYEVDLKHDMAAIGLFQILFIERYLPSSLEEALTYCLENSMSFILIAFDISEISIAILRRKKLFPIMSQTNKALEVVFFLYAGCLLYWISLHKSNHQEPATINLLVEKLATKQPDVLITLAREQFNLQSDRM